MNDDFMAAFEWLIDLTESKTHPEAKAQAYALCLAKCFAGAFDMDAWPRLTEGEQETFLSQFVPSCGGE